MVSLGVLAVLVIGVVFGPFVWRLAINDIDFAAQLKAPSLAHPFGTDDLGQDILARLISGGRISLAVGLAAMLVAVVVGVLVGATAGMSRGHVDAGLMWLADLFLSLPQLPLLLLIIYLFRDTLKTVLGPEGGVFVLIVAVIGGLRWMPVARLVRAQFLSLREKEFVEAAVEMLRLVQIPNAERRVHDYPHQFSGGMRQRAMFALALACKPQLLIADEPTTALDVTIQAQILELLAEMQQRLGMAILLITHAMGVVAENAQRVVVMYAGKVVEEAPVEELFGNPRHPYTQGLIRSIPRVDASAAGRQRLEQIPGTVPNLLNPPEGCRFAARCGFATDACRAAEPPLRAVGHDHKVACIL